ncbi:MAG: SufE family protein [Stomatobaculum sp.]|nr:SufE family protein [Stomatobaculum sp.]
MNDSLSDRMEKVTKRLKTLGDPFVQYDYFLMKGMELGDLPEIRSDSYRIAGCKTAIWIRLLPSDGGGVCFLADSDSLLVKGALSLMKEIYSGVSREEAAENPPAFLEAISDEVIYPDIKTGGLNKCWVAITSCLIDPD